MLASLPSVLRVPLAILALAGNILLHCLPLFAVTLLKLFCPHGRFRRRLSRMLTVMAESWIACNNLLFNWFTRIDWQLDVADGLRTDGTYLILCNHLSWVDIPVLQRMFNRRIPLLRFFLKSELIWVPFLGLAWWALDFPFMKRYSRRKLQNNPSLRGKDRESARRACERYRGMPVAIMNFVESTRFTLEKQQRQSSPYQNLLKPRAGGVSYVLDAMGAELDGIIDVTIAYPTGSSSMLDLILGRLRTVRARAELVPVPAELVGDYDASPTLRTCLQRWLNERWQHKDRLLSAWRDPGSAKPTLRNAVEADITSIVCLVESAYRGEVSRAGWTTEADLLDGQRIDVEGVAQCIGRNDSRVLLAEEDGSLLACCHIEKQDDVCYFGMFAVTPGRQGGGAGSSLLTEVERIAAEEWRCGRMRMTVIDARDDLIAWYQRRGYCRTGEHKPFPYGDARFGIPKRDDLRFEWLEKPLAQGEQAHG